MNMWINSVIIQI